MTSDDWRSLDSRRHVLLGAGPMVPGDGRYDDLKRHFSGTHRVVGPDATWQSIQPMLSTCGISRVADVTGLDEIGIPTFQAVRPQARSLSVTQGKGLTRSLARVSAVMEAIEFYCAENIDSVVASTIRSTPTELTYNVEDLDLLPRSLLGPDLVIEWVPATSIKSGKTTLVPLDCAKFTLETRRRWILPVFRASTNGLASGNTYAEAALHGLLELVERDCMASVTAESGGSAVQIATTTVDDTACLELITNMSHAGVALQIKAVTGRIAIPCFQASVWSPSLPISVSGWGCHLDPGIALARAITEAAQARLTIITGTRDDLVDELYTLRRTADAAHPAPSAGTRESNQGSFKNCPRLASDSITRDLSLVTDMVEAVVGTEPIIVDLSCGSLPVAVVKTIAPGLKHVTTRHAPHQV